jgi:hypothetical protein
MAVLHGLHSSHAHDGAGLIERGGRQRHREGVAHRLQARALDGTEAVQLHHHAVLLFGDAPQLCRSCSNLIARQTRQRRLAEFNPHIDALRLERRGRSDGCGRQRTTSAEQPAPADGGGR